MEESQKKNPATKQSLLINAAWRSLPGYTHRSGFPGGGARLQTCSSILPWSLAAAAVVSAQLLSTDGQSLAAV